MNPAPPRRARFGWAIAAVLVSLALAFVVARKAASDWLSAKAPEAALGAGLANAQALSVIATDRFVASAGPAGDRDAAALARAALIAEPLEPAALRDLALIAERAGEGARARQLMTLGDRRTRRDSLTELWLFQQALKERDWPKASLAADALMRRKWRLQRVVQRPLVASLGQPGAVEALSTRLAFRPDWRIPFLTEVAEEVSDPADAGRLLLALAATPAPPADAEAGPIIARYVADGDIAGARDLWLRLLPAGAPRPSQGVYDGDFQGLPGAAPFNWKLARQDGATVEKDRADDGKSALYVAASDGLAPLAAQLLTLAPGDWRLSGQASVGPGAIGEVFAWRLACIGRTRGAEARVAGGEAGWRPFSVEVAVPAKGCSAQTLSLWALGSEAEAWFRGLKAERIRG